MFIKFYDPTGDPFRSFTFIRLEFKDYGIKVIDNNCIAHMVQFSEFSYFIVVNK